MVFLFIVVAYFLICVALVFYENYVYENKMPKETLMEINAKIEIFKNLISKETNLVKQSYLMDEKEYWEHERDKLLNYQKKTGKIYEISRKQK
jgi:hypothetical protein